MAEDNCHLCHIHDHATSATLTRSHPLRTSQIRSRHASHSSRNEAVTTLPQTHGHSHNHNHIHTNGHVNGVDGHAGLALNASSLHRDSLHRQGSTRRNQEKVASVLARLSERSHSTSGSRNSTLTNDHVSVLPDGHANPDLSFSHVIPDPHNPIRRSKSHRNPFSGHLEHRSPSMPTHVSHSNINHEPDLIMTTLPRVPGGSRHSTLSRHNSMGHRIHHSHHNDTEQDYYINENRARYKDDERKQRFNLQTVMLIGCYTMLFVIAIIVGVVLCNQNGWLGFGSHNSESSRSGHISDSTGGGIPILDYPDVIDNRPRINRMPPDTTRVAVAGVGNIPRNPPQKPPANDGRPLRPGNNNGFTNSGSSDFPGQSRPGNNNGFANSGSSDFPGQSRPGNNNGFANSGSSDFPGQSRPGNNNGFANSGSSDFPGQSRPGNNNGFATSGPSNFDSTNSGKSFDPLRAFDQNVNNFDFDSNNNQGFGNNNLGINDPIRGNNQGNRNNFGTNNNQANNNQGISLLDIINNQGTNDNQANTNQGVSLLDIINDSGLGNSFNNPSNANNRGGLPSLGLGSSSDQGSSNLDNSQGGFGSRNNQRNSNNGNSGNSGTSFNDNSGFTGNQANSNNDDLSRGTSNIGGGFGSSKTNNNDNNVGVSNSRSEFENTGNNARTGAGVIRSSQSRNNQGQLDNFGVKNSQGSSAVRNNQNNENKNIPRNENRNNQDNQNQNNRGIQNMNNQGNQNRNNQGSFGNTGQGRNQVNSNNNQMGFDTTDSRNNNSPTENQSSLGNVGSNGNTRNRAQGNSNTGNRAQGNGNTGNIDLDNINLNIDAGFVKSQGVSNTQNPFGVSGRRNNQGTPSTSLNQNGQLKSVNINRFNQNDNRNTGSNFQNVQGGNSQSSSRTPARNNVVGSNPNQGSAISNVNRQSSGGNRQSNQGFPSNNGVPATNPLNNVLNNNRQNVGQNLQISRNSNQPNRATNSDMISTIRSNLPGPIHPPGSKGENWNSRPSGNTGENWNSNKGSQLQHSGITRQGGGRSLQNSNANINAGPVSNVRSPSSKPISHNRRMPQGNGTINHNIIGELLTHPNVFGGGISVQHGNLMSQSTVSMIDGDVIPAILRPTPDIIVHINPDSIGAGVTLKSTKSITERPTPRSGTRVQNNRKSQATGNSNSQKSIFVNRNQNSRPGNIGIPLPTQNQNSRPAVQSTSRTTPRTSSGSIGIPIPFINQRIPSQNQVKSISQATSPVRGSSGNIGIPLPSQNKVKSIAQATSPVRGTSQNTGIPIPSQNQNTAASVNQPNTRTQPVQNRKVVRTWTHTDTEGTYSQGQVRSDGSFLFTNCKPVGSCIS